MTRLIGMKKEAELKRDARSKSAPLTNPVDIASLTFTKLSEENRIIEDKEKPASTKYHVRTGPHENKFSNTCVLTVVQRD